MPKDEGKSEGALIILALVLLVAATVLPALALVIG
jgi:hypothetical protein